MNLDWLKTALDAIGVTSKVKAFSDIQTPLQALVSGYWNFIQATGVDDTAALQAAVSSASGGIVTLDPGRTYRVTDSIYCPSGRMMIKGNGATIVPAFGASYSKALFKNATGDASCTLYVQYLNILGNCTAFDFRFVADAPSAGLRLLLEKIYFNTMDGARRAGTRLLIADQIDFAGARNCNIWNADTAIVIGSAPPRRNCTQIDFHMLAIGQTNAAAYIRGVDKGTITSVDIAKCNSGLSFVGNNQRLTCERVHVEGLAMSGYSTASADVPAAATGVAYYFEDAQQNQDVIMRQCSVIDLGTTGGSAVAGIRVGRCDSPLIQSIEWDSCNIASTSEGSSGYKAIVNRGRLNWKGNFPYDPAVLNLSANALGYIETLIRDVPGMWARGVNLLNSSTVLGLTGSHSGTAAPTITENAVSYTKYAGHDVQFNSAYELTQDVLLPYGWLTLDVTGFKTAGFPVLLVQNNSTFADAIRVQFGSANDKERRWRISFFNATPGQSYRVGIASASATDNVHISAMSLYAGFSVDDVIDMQGPHVVAALPTASNYWLGKTAIVRVSGAADVVSVCRRNSAGNPVWLTAV